MANILRPLQVRSPFESLHGAASAVGAYEQLLGIREANATRKREQFRKEYIQNLLGGAEVGIKGDLEKLRSTDPFVFHQYQDAVRKSELGEARQQEQLRVLDQDSLMRGVRQTRGMLERYKEHIGKPTQKLAWQQFASNVEEAGAVEPGTYTEEVPTEEQMMDLQMQLDMMEEKAQDPIQVQQMDGRLRSLLASNSRKDALRIYNDEMQAELDLRKAQSEKARQDKQAKTVQHPTGLVPINPDNPPVERTAGEIRKKLFATLPVMQSLRRLKAVLRDRPWSRIAGPDKTRAEVLSILIQMQMKAPLELGSLDAGSQAVLNEIFPASPGVGWKAGIAIDNATQNFQDQLTLQARTAGYNIDFDEMFNVASLETDPIAALDTLVKDRLSDGSLTTQELLDYKIALVKSGKNNTEANEVILPLYEAMRQQPNAGAPMQRPVDGQQGSDQGTPRRSIAPRDAQRILRQHRAHGATGPNVPDVPPAVERADEQSSAVPMPFMELPNTPQKFPHARGVMKTNRQQAAYAKRLDAFVERQKELGMPAAELQRLILEQTGGEAPGTREYVKRLRSVGDLPEWPSERSIKIAARRRAAGVDEPYERPRFEGDDRRVELEKAKRTEQISPAKRAAESRDDARRDRIRERQRESMREYNRRNRIKKRSPKKFRRLSLEKRKQIIGEGLQGRGIVDFDLDL